MKLSRSLTARTTLRGFTLVEFIVYIAVSSVVIVTLVRSTLMLLDVQRRLSVLQPTQEETRFVLQRLTTSVRNALEINLADEGALSLAMSGRTIDPTVYSLVGGEVFLAEGTGAAVPLTSSKVVFEQLRFENLSAPGAFGTVKVRLQARDAENQKTMTVETAISLHQ